MARNTRELVETYFDAINAKQWDTWVDLFGDEIVFDDAISGRTEGIEAMRQSTQGIDQGFLSFNNHANEIVVEGDRAMAVCTIKAKTASGAEIESTGANFYRVDDGKIVYMASYHDPTPFYKAFGG